MSKYFYLELAIVTAIIIPVSVGVYHAQNKPKAEYTIACAKADEQVDRCIQVDKVFHCAEKRRKKIIKNDIYSNCVEHKF